MTKLKAFSSALAFFFFAANAVFADTIVSVTEMSYDAAFRPLCTATRMNPDTFGNAPGNACALGPTGPHGPDRITRNVYDAAGQVLQVQEAYGIPSGPDRPFLRAYATYTYSANGKVIDTIDSNGNRTRKEYDGFDRPKRIYYPSSTPSNYNPTTYTISLATAGQHNAADFEEFTYDDNSNLTNWRRRNGFTMNYTYDNLNRVVEEDLPAFAGNEDWYSRDILFKYDLLNQPIHKRFGYETNIGTLYYYNAVGQLKAVTDMHGRTTWHSYNQASARTRLTYSDGSYTAFILDAANRMSQIWEGGIQQAYFGYDSAGRRTNTLQNDGTIQKANVYDSFGRVTVVDLNSAGTSNDVTWTFPGYNPDNQVTSVTTSKSQFEYKEIQNTTVNSAFNGLNQDATFAAISGFDSNGNLRNDGSRSLVYDLRNRLIRSTGTANVVIDYDPEGRLSRYSIDGGNSYNTFLYDGVNLIAEYSPTGVLLRRYIHGPGVDEPLVWFEGGVRRYLVSDYRGSIVGSADGTGTITETYKYGPYGEPKNAINLEDWTGARFRYTGQLTLPQLQLYHYKARAYDPKFGRFLQTDPIGTEDDLNLYAYTGGDPINASDPDGTKKDDCSLSCHIKKFNTAVTDASFKLGWGIYDVVGKPSVDNAYAASRIVQGKGSTGDIELVVGNAALAYSGTVAQRSLMGSVAGRGTAMTTADFPNVGTRLSQKQNRHILGKDYKDGGYMNSTSDAQNVLDAYHSGRATILGRNNSGFPVVRYYGVTGTNVNRGVGITAQPSNVFIIKGTAKPSIVPTNPNWKQPQ